tara:strand:+ start:717 stop:830 length:114 start_codon:yes stop_codon:yes gene_type:complete
LDQQKKNIASLLVRLFDVTGFDLLVMSIFLTFKLLTQ